MHHTFEKLRAATFSVQAAAEKILWAGPHDREEKERAARTRLQEFLEAIERLLFLGLPPCNTHFAEGPAAWEFDCRNAISTLAKLTIEYVHVALETPPRPTQNGVGRRSTPPPDYSETMNRLHRRLGQIRVEADAVRNRLFFLGQFVASCPSSPQTNVQPGHRQAQSDEPPGVGSVPPAVTVPSTPPTEPGPFLKGWPIILQTLGMEDTSKHRGQIKKLNEEFNGPITFPGRGCQPEVFEVHLRAWHLFVGEEYRRKQKAEEEITRDRDVAATVADRHNFGRNGEVVPGVNGSVRRLRKGG